MPPNTAAVNPKTTQTVVEIAPMGYPNPADIVQFCKESREVYANYTRIIGPYSPSFGAYECTLDVELMLGLGTKGTSKRFKIT